MVSRTNETAVEDEIERSLIEEAHYHRGNPADFDRHYQQE